MLPPGSKFILKEASEMPSFMYITGDCRNMCPEEQQTTKVRCGPIDCNRVFQYLYGYRASDEECAKIKVALDAALPTLSRCQYDLLTAEFGADETSIAELLGATDVLFDDPADANVQKLELALQNIREHIQPWFWLEQVCSSRTQMARIFISEP